LRFSTLGHRLPFLVENGFQLQAVAGYSNRRAGGMAGMPPAVGAIAERPAGTTHCKRRDRDRVAAESKQPA
jgi:hypothetical protein